MLIRMKKAQGATEYAIFIAAVLAGLIALQVYYQRSVKGNIKSRADSIGDQFSMSTNNTYQTVSMSARRSKSGYHSHSGHNVTSSNEVMGNANYQGEVTSLNTLAGNYRTGDLGSELSYKGGAYSSTDYVDHATASVVTDASIGSHSAYNTGDFRKKNTFDEAGL